MRKQTIIIMLLAFSIFIITCTENKSSSTTAGNVLVSKYARPLKDVKFTATPQRIERGKYLANGILECFECHSPTDSTLPGFPPLKGKEGEGALFFQKDSFHLYAPNITPDKETGAGNWTDDMLARAIKEGVGHDGRKLHPAMISGNFCNLSDEDLAAVVVYIRSLPAIKNKLPVRHLDDGTERRLQVEETPKSFFGGRIDTSILAKGHYFLLLGDCESCHTGWYARNPGVFGGGNILHLTNGDSVCSPNITADGTGIGSWDDATFIRIMRTGKAGTLNPVMPWTSFRNISDADLKAMFTVLKTLKPIQHRVINGMPLTYCEVCGRMHGYGDKNKIAVIKPYPINAALCASYAGTYVSSFYGDTTFISYKDKKLWLHFQNIHTALTPISNTTFEGDGYFAPISFEKDNTGKRNIMVLHDLVADSSIRIN